MTDAKPQIDEAGSRLRGRLLVLLAAVLWSTSGLFAQAPTFDGWPRGSRGMLLAFWRAAFASVALMPFVRRPRWSIRLLPMLLCFVAMNVTFLTAMTRTEAALAIWLQNTAPLWVFLVGVFCFRESVVPRDWFLLLVCGAGVGLILIFEIRGAGAGGVVYGLLAGLTYAGVVLSLRQLRDHEAVWLVAVNHLVTAIVLAPFVVHENVWPQGEQWMYLAGFGVLQMGVPYVLFARGLRAITGHEASGIVLLEPILVPVWVFLAWRNQTGYQPPAWWTLAGGGLILAGLLLRYFGRRRTGVPQL